jgi:hypothetical protein
VRPPDERAPRWNEGLEEATNQIEAYNERSSQVGFFALAMSGKVRPSVRNSSSSLVEADHDVWMWWTTRRLRELERKARWS